MKKLFVFFALLFAVVGFVGCSKVSQSYADKINEAADKEEYYTFDEVMEDLGDEAQDYTGTLFGSPRAGFIYAIKGVTTKEEFEELRDSEEPTECLIIVIANGKATSAKYSTTEEAE